MCNDFKDGGLTSVDIVHKIKSSKCSGIKRLHDDNFHEWKIIQLHYINKALGSNFKFHSNLNLPLNILKKFSSFYKEVLQFWSDSSQTNNNLPLLIGSQFLWFNKQLKVDK